MIDNEFLKRVFKVAWPSVLESVFIALAGIIDTYMVSSLGTYAISAVGLTTQPKFIGLAIFFSISIAVSALVARRKGEEDRRSANEVLVTAFVVALIFCLAITTVMVSLSDPILKLAGSKTDTHNYAIEYFNIIMGFSVFNVISIVINAAQRGSGNTKIAFTTNLVSSIVNITFNYILINGKLGFPAMGVRGAAIATILGTFVASIMSIRSLFKKDSYVSLPFIIINKIKPAFDAFIKIMKLGLNMFAENLAMRVGFLSTALMAASLGTDQFAAHNVGMNVLSIGFAFADGMQVAAVALSGEALGAKKYDDAVIYGKTCQKVGFVISLALSAILLLFGKYIFGAFFQDETVINYGIMIGRFITVIVICQISQIIYGGCLRAAGDVKYTLIASIISVSIIRSVMTYVLVNIFHLGLMGIWLGVLSDQFSRLVFMSTRFRQGKWVEKKI
ncbi:MATE family efflux transporter [Fenollaria sporofastidiosus]|uniref:MATE family efflux transporter n=1 Tax=Fenollaria sporofastidiosus TaxID=2811778 RepID=UPI001C0089EE|nr:MATE family efflux transporter [Fenollaria sporofastidiosus]